MITAEFISNKLGGKPAGKGFLAHCPAHDDSSPSLSVSDSETGRVLFRCHKGCSQESVFSALKAKGLLGSPHTQPKEIVEFYQDWQGQDARKVVRKNLPDGRKSFAQFSKENEKWVPRAPAIEHAPFLFKEWKDSAFVFLVEGEKCARLLFEKGIPSTTTPGGAQGWKTHYAKAFKNKVVTILPDNDEPGRAYAKRAMNDILPEVKSVRILELAGLKAKEDVFDWFKRGGSKETLLSLANESHEEKTAEPRKTELICLSDVEVEEIDFLISPYIPLGKLTGIQGNPGDGKSFITCALAAAISTGGSFAGHQVRQGNVLMLNPEDGPGDTIKPRLEKLSADCSKIFVRNSPLELDTEGLRELEADVADKKPIAVILDPVQAFVGRIDMNRANEVRGVLSRLAQIAFEHKCAIIYVQHLKKGADRAIYKAMGSVDFLAAARSALMVGRNPKDQNQRAMIHIKSNLAPFGPSIGFMIDEGTLKWTGESNLTADDLMASSFGSSEEKAAIDEAKEFLESALRFGPIPFKQLRTDLDGAGISIRTAERAKKESGIQSVKKGNEWFWEAATPPRPPRPPTLPERELGGLDNLAVLNAEFQSSFDVGAI